MAGGIHGRKIEIKEYDHGETADGGVAACKAIVADKAVYVPFEIQGAIAHLTAANCLDEAGVTNLVWQASDDFVGKWTHDVRPPPPSTQGQVTARYIKSTISPTDKVAFAIGSADIFKAQGDAMKAEAEKLGIDVVDTQYIEQTGTTFVPQLQSMKDAGATGRPRHRGFRDDAPEGSGLDRVPPEVDRQRLRATTTCRPAAWQATASRRRRCRRRQTPPHSPTTSRWRRNTPRRSARSVLSSSSPTARASSSVPCSTAGPDFTEASLAKAVTSITAYTTMRCSITWTADSHAGTEALYRSGAAR